LFWWVNIKDRFGDPVTLFASDTKKIEDIKRELTNLSEHLNKPIYI
jgi:hypothetical protein